MTQSRIIFNLCFISALGFGGAVWAQTDEAPLPEGNPPPESSKTQSDASKPPNADKAVEATPEMKKEIPADQKASNQEKSENKAVEKKAKVVNTVAPKKGFKKM